MPSVWQSGDSKRSGGITKQGSPALRRILTQARARPALALSLGGSSTTEGDRHADPHRTQTAQDRRRRCGATHPSHRLLRAARRHGLRPDPLGSRPRGGAE
ncbi:MAG: transposase [Myxococcales bacterium]|nr:transposase [Myxococcales bacterium]